MSPGLMKAMFDDALVYQMVNLGRNMEEIVIALAEARRADRSHFFKEIAKLQAIAPRKITAPDGKVYVYRCPDHLIPG